MPDEPAACLLPFPLPESRTERALLFALRRMAGHGIRDAQAALILLDLFGARFRRPLVLLRAFILEFAQASRRSVRLAPCCSPRMTADEAQLLGALTRAPHDPAGAERMLIRLSGNPCMCEALSAAAVLGAVFAEFELACGQASHGWAPN